MPFHSISLDLQCSSMAWVIAAVELIDLATEAIEGVATVVLEEWNSGQSEQLGSSIASLATPEALVHWIGDIEQQEGIG